MGLRGLNITNGVHSLPRPIWKGNPLSSSLHKPVKDQANDFRKREKAEREYRGVYSARVEFGCARLQGMVDLAAAKIALKLKETHHNFRLIDIDKKNLSGTRSRGNQLILPANITQPGITPFAHNEEAITRHSHAGLLIQVINSKD